MQRNDIDNTVTSAAQMVKNLTWLIHVEIERCIKNTYIILEQTKFIKLSIVGGAFETFWSKYKNTATVEMHIYNFYFNHLIRGKPCTLLSYAFV